MQGVNHEMNDSSSGTGCQRGNQEEQPWTHTNSYIPPLERQVAVDSSIDYRNALTLPRQAYLQINAMYVGPVQL
jgi:hypothetical protein